MVKVVRPLFSDSARGRIANIGSFRMSRNGPQFISQGKPRDPKTIRQLQLRQCFREARAVWQNIPPTNVGGGNRTVMRIIPKWDVFWAQWRIDHPDCQ